jgi:quinol monooxygenase YgiN
MQVTRLLAVGCAIVLSAMGCGGGSTATEPTESAETTGAETPAPVEPAPMAEATPAPAPAPVAAPAPAPAPVAAAPAEPQMPPLGTIVTHKVKDYAAWKTAFDTHQQARADAGIVAHCVMKDVKKPNTVSVWAAYSDQAKVDALFSSDDMKAKMKEAGVVGKPTMVGMKHVGMSPPTDKQPKFGATADHKVKDFAAWKAAFDGHDQARKDAGIVGWAVSQDPKDEKHVIVWLEADDQAKLEEFFKNKDLKAKMKEAGVQGAPKVTVYEIAEFKMYGQPGA